MSVCLIIQKQNEVFIGTDTAICSFINNKYVRTGEYEDKFFIKDNIGYYCSGKLEITDKVKEYIKDNSNVENIINYIKLLDNQYSFNDLDIELMIVSLDKCIHISKYNNFEPIEYIINNNDDMYLLSIGFKASYNWHKLYENLINNNQSKIDSIKNTITSSICQEIGGKCKVYHLDGNSFNLVDNERIDNITFQNTKDNQFLINGEVLMGNLIAGNQLIIKNANNSFIVDGNSAVLTNASLTIETTKNKILLDPTVGIKFQKKDNSVLSDIFYVDENGDLAIKGGIKAGSTITGSTIQGSLIKGGEIYIGGNQTASDCNFGVTPAGKILGLETVNGLFKVGANGDLVINSNLNVNGTTVIDGDTTIKGNVRLGGSITWDVHDPTIAIAKNIADSALSDANSAKNKAEAIGAGTYSGTFINGKTIISPTIETNLLTVQIPNQMGSTSGLLIKGYYDNANRNFFKIGYSDAILPTVNFGSPEDAKASWDFGLTSFNGRVNFNDIVDFSSATSISWGNNAPVAVFGG